jgi:hypothetical protein
VSRGQWCAFCGRQSIDFRGNLGCVRGTVLRGEYLRLRRRGGRVWIRYRPYELVWRTTHSFAVDEIRLIEIQPVELEQRRRRVVMGRARTRLTKRAVTRLTIQDANTEVSLELEETEAAIVGVFQDLADRLAAEGGWRVGRTATQEPPPISATPAPEPEIDLEFERDLDGLFEDGDRVASEPFGDASSAGESLFPDDEPGVAERRGVWIRKRRSRTPRFFGRE